MDDITKQKLGASGENQTAYQISFLRCHHCILQNLYIPAEKSKYSEIDIIYINPYGIFVIENKNFSGWIFGTYDDYEWTQSLNNNTKYRFYNPIKQNETHIKNLKRLLDSTKFKHNRIISVINFNQKAEIKKGNYRTENILVTTEDTLFYALFQYNDHHEKIYTDEEINEIYTYLDRYTDVPEEIKQEHIEQINTEINNKEKEPFIEIKKDRNGNYIPSNTWKNKKLETDQLRKTIDGLYIPNPEWENKEYKSVININDYKTAQPKKHTLGNIIETIAKIIAILIGITITLLVILYVLWIILYLLQNK